MENKFQIRVAGFAFLNTKLLLITHKKENKEYYVVPGGRVEFKEKISHALIREFKEELNLKIKIIKFLFFNEVFPPDYYVHSLNLFFLVKPVSHKIILEKNGIIGKYKYFNRNQIKKLLIYPKINNIIYKNFSLWLKEVK